MDDEELYKLMFELLCVLADAVARRRAVAAP